MKKLLLIAVCISLIASCTSRDWQSLNRTFAKQKGNYVIEMYSGGNIVFADTFYGTINQESETDGIYYVKNDTLIELSGDYVIKMLPRGYGY